MGDMTEGFREMTKQKQERHRRWKQANRDIIIASSIPFTEKPEAYLFRERDKPKVDFYPSTGRWKSDNQMYSGGAEKFLEWYASQIAKERIEKNDTN